MSTDFGRDTWCVDSLKTGKYATGANLIAQLYYHALITVRGQLRGTEDDLSFGEDIEGLCGSVRGKDTESKIRAKCQRAASKIEQIKSIEVSITSSSDAAGDWTHTVTVEAETAEGPFRLVLAIGSVNVELLGLVAL